jgi:hypothetical protein
MTKTYERIFYRLLLAKREAAQARADRDALRKSQRERSALRCHLTVPSIPIDAELASPSILPLFAKQKGGSFRNPFFKPFWDGRAW